ncbi:aspartate/glutamate racemase family protein [Thalassobacillus devorans]|uniref:aspartate/glutamate racemase family protein n=1 Tax=Thalassobacillus devorans TaxID=279813 RepID=UPI00048F4A54|nr:amino acid racemase [Thalassobacillus devorans]
MERAGIIGGLGPESTVDYYKLFIEKYQQRVNSRQKLPELYINSINMYNIFHFISENQMDELIEYVGGAAKQLESIGADFIVIAANTPHIVFEEIRKQVNVPMISIVEATYERTRELGIKNAGLLGTKFTMEHDFFKEQFWKHKEPITVPSEQQQAHLHEKIVDELENGIVKENTKEDFLRVINQMIEESGIDGLILGCTELPMILKEGDVAIPLINTMEIHVDKMVEHMFRDE